MLQLCRTTFTSMEKLSLREIYENIDWTNKWKFCKMLMIGTESNGSAIFVAEYNNSVACFGVVICVSACQMFVWKISDYLIVNFNYVTSLICYRK